MITSRRPGVLTSVGTTVLLGALLFATVLVRARGGPAVATFVAPAGPSPTASAPGSPSASTSASASASAGATPGPSVTASPTADPTASVTAAVQGYLAGQGGYAALAVLDLTTGLGVSVNATAAFDTASIVKVDILATLLLQAQGAGRALTASEQELATEMITESDNDAADDLWSDIGGASGLAGANRTFGLTGTTPGADGYWGLTRTTAADQLRLLQVLAGASSPLTPSSREYVLGLMAQVDDDQRWGITAAAGTAATATYVKNGWLSLDDDDGLWIVNSIGRIVEPGHDWLVVVLSGHRSSESAGIAVVERAATLAVGGLRS